MVTAFRAIMHSIENGEDPEQLRLAIHNAKEQELILRPEVSVLESKMKE